MSIRLFLYPLVVFVFNYSLFKGFPSGGGGTGLGFLIVWPLIAIITGAAIAIHMYFAKKGKNLKVFQMIMLFVLMFISYSLFITEPDNTPLDVLRRMGKTRSNYDQISINDYFIDDHYYNYEKIVAAKRKFHRIISDTSYSVEIKSRYNPEPKARFYGIIYKDGSPLSTNMKIKIARFNEDTFRFSYYTGKDSVFFYSSRDYISDPSNIRDSFMTYGAGFSKDTTLIELSTHKTGNVTRQIVGIGHINYFIGYYELYHECGHRL